MTTIPHDTTGGSDLDVHRLLDQAFAGVEMTTEQQDLKEEVRANLVARVAELRAGGLPGGRAAQQAVEELGDVRAIVDGTEPAGRAAATAPWGHRVRPRPAFVLRTVALSALGAAGLAVLALAATIVDVPLGLEITAALAVAVTAGAVTADALRQETTGNHPMPTRRAAAYGAGVLLGTAGLGGGWLYLRGAGAGWLVGGAVLLLAAVGLVSYLGATQTNRHKPWVVRMQESHAAVGDRFTEDPSAAARFGIYTVVTWLLAISGFVVLTLTVGWIWSWLAVVGGMVVMMLMVARMLFVPRS
ncbi:permease prefix domain 1-containing protein [Krasilnikovia sp. MM14-A1004]|uniref:permease prefix domain 1-containing protein n=1 Tax=Krasilnikovia sp. MM14-A1004 TaxID=3373541 RepID=UPI00399C53C6